MYLKYSVHIYSNYKSIPEEFVIKSTENDNRMTLFKILKYS